MNLANEWYYKVFTTLTPHNRTVQEIDGFLRLSQNHNLFFSNSKHISILDTCCGYGRHSIELAKRGFNVLGVDISLPLIRQAQSVVRKERQILDNLDFLVGDIRAIPASDASFNVVINMYTSFGNYADHENKTCLTEMNRVLREGGYIFFDLNNLFNFLAGNRIGTHFLKLEDDSLLYLEDTRYDPIDGREYQKAEYYYKGKLKHSYNLSLRRYTFTEFKDLLTSTGFEYIAVYGDFDGSRFDASPPSKRMIVIAKKISIINSF